MKSGAMKAAADRTSAASAGLDQGLTTRTGSAADVLPALADEVVGNVASAALAHTSAVAPSAFDAIMPTYARTDVSFVRGEGSWLFDQSGARYLDFTSGIAVNCLGHAHPHLVAALQEQAAQLWHTSNLYRMPNQERLAQRLVEATFADRVFFCNSGAEACEGAMKAARRYQSSIGQTQKTRFLTFSGAFHGRTLGALAASGNEKYLAGFGPAMPGFTQVDIDDVDAIAREIAKPDLAAVIIEPLQGEGGIKTVPRERLQALRAACDDHGVLLIFDEVQCGVGRTGYLFEHQRSGVVPDIMTIAKGIGGGFPIGAFMTTASVGDAMAPGSHGSTFGGNPLATAVGNAVLDIVAAPEFLVEVTRKGNLLIEQLEKLKQSAPDQIAEIRGRGLLLGIKLKSPSAALVSAAFEAKLLLVGAAENVVRIIPPLNATDDDLHEAVTRLKRALGQVARGQAH
ncbi:MAG: aspartate aminotransferase family protein [Pseudomonadota bacterium]